MRVLHVIPTLQRAAGTSIFVAKIAQWLSKAGVDVSVAIADPLGDDIYPLSHQVRLISIADLLKSRTLTFDIVHIHALWVPILHRVNAWARKTGKPVVWSPHGMLTPWAMNNKRWKKWLGWWLYQKWDLRRAQLIHVTANSEMDDVRRLGLANKVIIAPLGVDSQDCFERARHDNGKRVLLFVSRVQKKKGLCNLAKAWAMLSRELRDKWCVRIVGPDQEDHTKEVLVECDRLGVAKEWAFVGPKYEYELQQEYANADIFVLPTFSENFGSVVIEALARSVPVITTKGAPWEELIKRQCGWWIDIGVEPLADALKDAMSLGDAQRREMGARGRALVEEKYTWDAVVKAMMKGYEEVLNGRT